MIIKGKKKKTQKIKMEFGGLKFDDYIKEREKKVKEENEEATNSWKVLYGFQNTFRQDHNISGSELLEMLNIPIHMLQYLYWSEDAHVPSTTIGSIGGDLRKKLEELKCDSTVNVTKRLQKLQVSDNHKEIIRANSSLKEAFYRYRYQMESVGVKEVFLLETHPRKVKYKKESFTIMFEVQLQNEEKGTDKILEEIKKTGFLDDRLIPEWCTRLRRQVYFSNNF